MLLKVGDLARRTGLTVRTVADAVKDAQLVSILLPDQVQPQVFTEHIEQNLAPGAAVLFAASNPMSRDNRPAGQRQLRVGEELRHALAHILERGDLRDPALAATPVTVTEVLSVRVPSALTAVIV